MTDIHHRLQAIEQTLASYPTTPSLLAVSKKQSAHAIEQAYSHGQRHFGENYVQEALQKITTLKHLTDIQWHFIGTIQSNKCKAVAEHFHWVQSLDRLKIAQKLNEACPEGKLLSICVQVNIDQEQQKAGIPLTQVQAFCEHLLDFDHLRLRGLMALPQAQKSIGAQRQSFARLAQEFKQLQRQWPTLDTLSMGMSTDYQLAIEEGASMVRLGSAIFGERKD